MRLSDTQRLFAPNAAPMTSFSGILRRLHIDGPLLGGLLLVCAFGLFVLYSAVGESNRLLLNQVVRMGVAFVAMLIVAQLPPDFLRRWTPWGYAAGLILLVLVLTQGDVGQGARRWLDLGIRFQPSEAMKLGVPMMTAWYLHDRQIPPSLGQLLIIAVMIAVPTYSLQAARPRYVPADCGLRRHRHRAGGHVVPADAWPGRRRRTRRACPLEFHAGLPEATRPDTAQSGQRPAWRRLQHHPVEDRDRLRRACLARAGPMARRHSSNSCRNAIPTSSSPCLARNSACWVS